MVHFDGADRVFVNTFKCTRTIKENHKHSVKFI